MPSHAGGNDVESTTVVLVVLVRNVDTPPIAVPLVLLCELWLGPGEMNDFVVDVVELLEVATAGAVVVRAVVEVLARLAAVIAAEVLDSAGT